VNRTRRDAITLSAALAVPAVAAAAEKSKSGGDRKKAVHYRNGKPKETPLYSEVISCGDFVFVSGHGTNKVGGIREQTEFVLNEIDACLKAAGSSMAKAVKCNVYLSKLDDYKAMNEAYLGKFGAEPPVRTTVAVAGIPLDGALVEIEVMAQR
jgi:enamine deaminase RidA (YjgF/YER057c/UK114 family)